MVRAFPKIFYVIASFCLPAAAQFESVPEFTPTVRLALAEVPDLERAASLLANQQWDQAIETLRRVMEVNGDDLLRLPEVQHDADTRFVRYVTVRDICHREIGDLARVAPDALATYRRRVDPLAKQWFDRAVAEGDAKHLERIVDLLFNSSYGDDALFQLGDLAWQNGKLFKARWCWERISPLLRTPSVSSPFLKAPAGAPLWLALRGVDLAGEWEQIEPLLTQHGGRSNWLAYPDTDIDLAKVRARLVLVSVFDKSPERLAIEMDVFRRLHGDSQGYLAGKRGRLVELLDQIVQASEGWPTLEHEGQGKSFAGAFTRQYIAPRQTDIAGHPLWGVELPRIDAEQEMLGYGRARISETFDGLLSYHPIVVRLPGVGPAVLWSEASLVRAIRLDNGAPVWPLGTSDDTDPKRKGWIYNTEKTVAQLLPPTRSFMGAPRFTLSVFQDKLFVRMGGLRTSSRDEVRASADQSVIVGLDLSRQGRLLPGFELRPESLEWQFEGSPVANGRDVFVALRRSTTQGALPELHVAAYELHVVAPGSDRRISRPRWRTKICAANTPAGGIWDEVTHNLLTLREDSIYCNSNLGAVAAVTTDGQLRWLTSYPRSAFRPRDPDQSDLHYMRDLNPCLAFGDYVIAAPTDSDRVFALDAKTGQLRWEIALADVVHLIGVGEGNLLAGGDSLYWIDLHSGKLVGQFPQPTRLPKPDLTRTGLPGYGRGVLAGDVVYWPTRDQIFVFKQRTQKHETADGRFVWEPVGVRQIDLRPRNVQGGNLILAEGVLLIAGADRLVAFDEFGPASAE